MWNVLKHNKIGEQHEAAHQPYEDYSKTVELPDRLILAVADGHGSSQCCRANMGARFACEAACEVLSQENPDFSTIHYRIKALFDRKVDFDLSAWPLDSTETSLLGLVPDAYAYGTTLLCVMLSPKGTYRFQIGDGSMFLVDHRGALLPALPEDPDCYGNRTTSLVFEDAADYIRWDVVDEPVAGALLHTDGYACGSRCPWPLLELLKDMPETIPEQILKAGSHGDDQTILLALDETHAANPGFRTGLEMEQQWRQLVEDRESIFSDMRRCETVIRCLIPKIHTAADLRYRSQKIRELAEYQKKFDELEEQIRTLSNRARQIQDLQETLCRQPPARQQETGTHPKDPTPIEDEQDKQTEEPAAAEETADPNTTPAE